MPQDVLAKFEVLLNEVPVWFYLKIQYWIFFPSSCDATFDSEGQFL